MKYDPRTERPPLRYDPFKSCTVPRPIGWISTISTAGIANLAPFSQWQNLTFDPPMVMFASNQSPDGKRKDTVTNAEQTGYFVWNMATWDLREAVNISAADFPPDVDEFAKSGVTKAPCVMAPGPRVAESPVHMECRYHSTTRLPGRGAMGTVDIVFGEVVQIHIRDDVVLPTGKLDIAKIAPIARLGYYDYCVVRETFEMVIPAIDPRLLAGLEGQQQ
jgi:flavin reductase (DIM6/NTAB) family NADH-FMN oxidoreductase RutF